MKCLTRSATARLGIAVLLIAAPCVTGAQTGALAQVDSARYAWAAGRYVEALTLLERALSGPGAAAALDSAALLTGELYRTTELLHDGRNVRWSPDGNRVLVDAGIDQPTATTVLTVTGEGLRPQTTIAGAFGATLSPDGRTLAYLTISESTELRAARERLATMLRAGDRQDIATQRDRIASLERASTRVVERDMQSGRDRVVRTPDQIVAPVVYGSDGTLYVIGRGNAAAEGPAVYALSATGSPRKVTDRLSSRGSLQALPGGRLLYLTGPREFAILRLRDGLERQYQGMVPAVSVDGSSVVFVATKNDTNSVSVVRLDSLDTVTSFASTTDPISRPAMAADGRTIVYQQMPDHDWELFVVDADSAVQRRLTREIQHDLFPTWVAGSRILSVLGESRHRRSYLLDPVTGERTRLFDNNLLRTVSMEYEWAPSPDRSRVAIVAERDGNTISPERGVYVVDLTRKVTVPEVRARVSAMLAEERDLRARAQAMFAPIAPAVRDVVAQISVARIYAAAEAVHAFGSKFITEPGNRQAIEFYAGKLREYGYEPELQWFEPRPGVRSANVIARLTGTVNPELLYVVSSHFDSVEDGPGADDNSSGSTVLLEAARVMAGKPQPATIVFAFFTAEEAGLRGSREFVRRAVASGDRIVGALNNDMVGWSGDARFDNTIRYSNDGLRDLQHAAALEFTDLITYDARYYKSTDAHAYFEAYGDIVAGIGSYPILSNPHYHQSHDILATIDHRLVAEVSKTTAASVMLMASSPSRLAGLTVSPPRGGAAQAQWTASPEQGVRTYQVTYGPPDEPARRTLAVSEPRAALPGAQAGWVVRVRAVNERGLHAWDWARAEIK
jgi:Tol biopolymer transport system component